MLQNYWKFKNRNVQTFGFVYHDTNGLNHGPVWKTQSFLLSEICTVILWQDCYWKGNLRKSYWGTVGRRIPVGNAFFVHREKRVILIGVCGWRKIGWKENKTLIRCGNYYNCWTMFESRISAGATEKLPLPGKSAYLFVVTWHGRSCQEMCRTILWVGKQKRLNNSTKYQLHALMTIISKQKSWNRGENCHKYALK